MAHHYDAFGYTGRDTSLQMQHGQAGDALLRDPLTMDIARGYSSTGHASGAARGLSLSSSGSLSKQLGLIQHITASDAAMLNRARYESSTSGAASLESLESRLASSSGHAVASLLKQRVIKQTTTTTELQDAVIDAHSQIEGTKNEITRTQYATMLLGKEITAERKRCDVLIDKQEAKDRAFVKEKAKVGDLEVKLRDLRGKLEDATVVIEREERLARVTADQARRNKQKVADFEYKILHAKEQLEANNTLLVKASADLHEETQNVLSEQHESAAETSVLRTQINLEDERLADVGAQLSAVREEEAKEEGACAQVEALRVATRVDLEKRTADAKRNADETAAKIAAQNQALKVLETKYAGESAMAESTHAALETSKTNIADLRRQAVMSQQQEQTLLSHLEDRSDRNNELTTRLAAAKTTRQVRFEQLHNLQNVRAQFLRETSAEKAKGDALAKAVEPGPERLEAEALKVAEAKARTEELEEEIREKADKEQSVAVLCDAEATRVQIMSVEATETEMAKDELQKSVDEAVRGNERKAAMLAKQTEKLQRGQHDWGQLEPRLNLEMEMLDGQIVRLRTDVELKEAQVKELTGVLEQTRAMNAQYEAEATEKTEKLQKFNEDTQAKLSTVIDALFGARTALQETQNVMASQQSRLDVLMQTQRELENNRHQHRMRIQGDVDTAADHAARSAGKLLVAGRDLTSAKKNLMAAEGEGLRIRAEVHKQQSKCAHLLQQIREAAVVESLPHTQKINASLLETEARLAKQTESAAEAFRGLQDIKAEQEITALRVHDAVRARQAVESRLRTIDKRCSEKKQKGIEREAFCSSQLVACSGLASELETQLLQADVKLQELGARYRLSTEESGSLRTRLQTWHTMTLAARQRHFEATDAAASAMKDVSADLQAVTIKDKVLQDTITHMSEDEKNKERDLVTEHSRVQELRDEVVANKKLTAHLQTRHQKHVLAATEAQDSLNAKDKMIQLLEDEIAAQSKVQESLTNDLKEIKYQAVRLEQQCKAKQRAAEATLMKVESGKERFAELGLHGWIDAIKIYSHLSSEQHSDEALERAVQAMVMHVAQGKLAANDMPASFPSNKLNTTAAVEKGIANARAQAQLMAVEANSRAQSRMATRRITDGIRE